MIALGSAGRIGGAGRIGPVAAPRRHPFHWPLALVTTALTCFGAVMVFSAGRGPTNDTGFGSRQAVFALVGLVVLAVASMIDYRRLQRGWPMLLAGAAVGLIAVLTPLGTEVRGTQGWFRFGGIAVQPSEFAKLALVVGLAVVLNGPPGRRSSPGVTSAVAGPLSPPPIDRPVAAPGPGRFALAVALLGAFSGLVLAQGESGTVLVYCALTLGMLATAGVPSRYLALLTVSGIAVIGLALSAEVLAPYQVDRFEAFLDSELDPQGVGYNQQQALTAIGSGGLIGAGLFDGPQTQLGYLPDQHTDFIFAAVAEELGFAGAVTIVVLEAAILAFVFLIGRDSTDRFGQLICAGVFSLLAFQVFQNVAMNLRLMPITGISLPFVSYGGSSLITSLLAVGLVQSVAVHRSDRRPRSPRHGAGQRRRGPG